MKGKQCTHYKESHLGVQHNNLINRIQMDFNQTDKTKRNETKQNKK